MTLKELPEAKWAGIDELHFGDNIVDVEFKRLEPGLIQDYFQLLLGCQCQPYKCKREHE